MFAIDKTLAPVDELRRTLLQAALRVSWLRTAVVRRDTRLSLTLLLYTSLAFVVALLAPSWALVVSPLLLGVPHVAADVRYLVLRRRLPRFAGLVIAAFACAMIGLRALHEARVLRLDTLLAEHALGVSWVALGAMAGGVARPLRFRSALVTLGTFAIAVSALSWPQVFRHALVHGHNLVALVIWCALFQRSLRHACLSVGLVVMAALVLASGAVLPFTLRYGALSIAGLHLFQAADWIAPGLGDERALALTICFAFLQSVHYAIWLIVIPQSDSRAAGPPTFRMKARALRRDFGAAGLWIIALGIVVVAIAGGCSPLQTRNVYLSLASFHSWLELALLAYLGASAAAR